MRKLEYDKTNILFNDNNIHTNTDKHNEHNFHNRTQISYWLIKKAVGCCTTSSAIVRRVCIKFSRH